MCGVNSTTWSVSLEPRVLPPHGLHAPMQCVLINCMVCAAYSRSHMMKKSFNLRSCQNEGSNTFKNNEKEGQHD